MKKLLILAILITLGVVAARKLREAGLYVMAAVSPLLEWRPDRSQLSMSTTPG